MTGIKKHPQLTKESILEKVNEYDIFARILGDFKVGVSFCNTHRGENTESAIVRNINGKLIMKDYGDGRYNGDCFHLVEFTNNCNFYEALELIERDFNLKSENVVKRIIPESKSFSPPNFKVITRPFSKTELKFWSEFYQGVEDLKRENIFAPKEIWRNYVKIPITQMTFCYFYPELNKFKIYRPYGKVGKKVRIDDRKWDSGIPFNVVEGLEDIINCEKVFIATSKKDKMVLRKALELECICNIQGENIASINDEDMEYIKSNSEIQYLAGDNDEAGVKFSWMMTNTFGFKHVNPPYDKPKDFSDWAKEFGLEEIKEHFIKKGLVI